MTGSSDQIFTDIETGISTAESILPMLAPIFSLIPGLSAIVPFLQLLPVAMTAVQTVQKATGASTTDAKTIVQQHLTKGMPNAPALNG